MLPSSTTTTTTTTTKETKTLYILIPTFLLSLIFILSLSSQPPPPNPTSPHPVLFPFKPIFLTSNPSDPNPPPPSPPSLAYLLSGSSGDVHRLLRLLSATYHPNNHYLLHLDLSAPQSDRDGLALAVQSVPIFRAAGNVNVIGNAAFSYSKGSSSIASTLRGAAILLRLSEKWDWFINLSAGDYPLVTQDDLLHTLSYLPKDLNFVNHTSYIGWRESKRLRPIIVDPGLYLADKNEMFYATQKRDLPSAYRLFTGSSSSILTRSFIESCILGSDNLPRTLLMYLSNTPSSMPNYFPTIICNSRQFNRTTVNYNLQYASFDRPSKDEPRLLGPNDFDELMQSGSAFATRFPIDDPVLDRIDREVLSRSPREVVPGGWCLGESRNETCLVWGDASVLRPGPGAKRLEKRIVEILSNGMFRSRQCVVE